MLTPPEEVLFKVLGSNVCELGRSTVIYFRPHVDDVANVPLVVLVLPFYLRNYSLTGRALSNPWGW